MRINKRVIATIMGATLICTAFTMPSFASGNKWDWNKTTFGPADFAGCPYDFGDVTLDPQSAVVNDVGTTIDHSCTDEYLIGYGIDYKMPAMWEKFNDVYNLAVFVAPYCNITGDVTIKATLSKDLDTSTFTTQSVIDSFKADNDPAFVAIWDNYNCTFDTDNNLTFTMSFRNGVTGAEVKAVADNNPIIKLTFDKVKLPNNKFDVGQSVDVTNVSFEEDIDILAPANFGGVLLGTVHVSGIGNDDSILERGKLEYEYRSAASQALPAEIRALEPSAETIEVRPTIASLTQPSTTEVVVNGTTWEFLGYMSIETYADDNGTTCEKDICDDRNAHLEAIGVWDIKVPDIIDETTATESNATPTDATEESTEPTTEAPTKHHSSSSSSSSSSGGHAAVSTTTEAPASSTENAQPSQALYGVDENRNPLDNMSVGGSIPKTGEDTDPVTVVTMLISALALMGCAFYFVRRKEINK